MTKAASSWFRKRGIGLGAVSLVVLTGRKLQLCGWILPSSEKWAEGFSHKQSGGPTPKSWPGLRAPFAPPHPPGAETVSDWLQFCFQASSSLPCLLPHSSSHPSSLATVQFPPSSWEVWGGNRRQGSRGTSRNYRGSQPRAQPGPAPPCPGMASSYPVC